MTDESFEEYSKRVRRVHDKRYLHRPKSQPIKYAHKQYNKMKPNSKEYILTKDKYSLIITRICELFADYFVKGYDIKLPYSMGTIKLQKRPYKVGKVNGKYTTNTSIDWHKTLQLWYEDKKAYNNRDIVKIVSKYNYYIKYDISKARFCGKQYYKFQPSAVLFRRVRQAVNDGLLDTTNN